jgi:hypothetical protein
MPPDAPVMSAVFVMIILQKYCLVKMLFYRNCLDRHFAFLVKFDPQTAICVIKHLFFTIPIAVFTRPANVRDYWNNSNTKYVEI